MKEERKSGNNKAIKKGIIEGRKENKTKKKRRMK